MSSTGSPTQGYNVPIKVEDDDDQFAGGAILEVFLCKKSVEGNLVYQCLDRSSDSGGFGHASNPVYTVPVGKRLCLVRWTMSTQNVPEGDSPDIFVDIGKNGAALPGLSESLSFMHDTGILMGLHYDAGDTVDFNVRENSGGGTLRICILGYLEDVP